MRGYKRSFKRFICLVLALLIPIMGINISTESGHFIQFGEKAHADTLISTTSCTSSDAGGSAGYGIWNILSLDASGNTLSVNAQYVGTKTHDVSSQPNIANYVWVATYTIDWGNISDTATISFTYNKTTSTISNLTVQSLTNVNSWSTQRTVTLANSHRIEFYIQATGAGAGCGFNSSLYSQNNNPTFSVSSPTNGTSSAVSLNLQGTYNDADVGNIMTVNYNIDGGATTTFGAITSDGTSKSFNKVVDITGITAGARNLNVWVADNKGGQSPITTIPFTKLTLYYYNKYSLADGYVDNGSSTYVNTFCGTTNYSFSGYTSYTFNPIANTYSNAGTFSNTMDSPVVYNAYGDGIQVAYTGTYLSWYSYSIYDRKAWRNGTTKLKGNLVQSNIQAPDGTYPNDGIHTDNYWYVKGSVVNNNPSLSIASPLSNTSYAAITGRNIMTLTGAAIDANVGDVLTIKYNVDGGATQTVSGTITANGSSQPFTPTSISVNGLSPGTHNLNVWAEDNTGKLSTVVSIPFIVEQLYYYNKYNCNNYQLNFTWAGSIAGNTYFNAGVGAKVYHGYTFDPTTGTITGTGIPVTGPAGSGFMHSWDGDYYGHYVWDPTYGWFHPFYEYSTIYSQNMSVSPIASPTKSTFIQTVIAIDGTYPNDGKHSDGYWYTKGAAINNNPVFTIRNPHNNQIYSSVPGFNRMILTVNVVDANNGDTLTAYYNIDGGSTQTLAGTVNTSGDFSPTEIDVSGYSEGSHTINGWCKDQTDNMSNVDHVTFIIDKTAPSISTNIIDGQTYQGSVTPTFSAIDVNGMQTIMATLDGSPYSNGTPVNTEGNHVLTVTSTDIVGNQSTQTVNFFINKAPSINATTTDNITFSTVSGFNALTAEGTIKDLNIGDTLKLYYRIDGSNGQAGIQLGNDVTADGTDQAYREYIDVSGESEGVHTVSLWTEDANGGKSAETTRSFRVDKTNPVSNAPVLTVDSATQITIQPDGNDPASVGVSAGLHVTPYQFNRDNSDIGIWQSGNFIDSSLTPNTRYTYKYKTRDAVGNEGSYSVTGSAFTLALDPDSVEITSTGDTSITVIISGSDLNGNLPEYKLEIKDKGAGITGSSINASGWSTATTRTLTGLTAGVEYEVWLTTRNGNNIENASVLCIGSIFTNNLPVIELTGSATNYTIDENGNMTVSGKVYDLDAGSVTVSAIIGGVTKSVSLNSTPTSSPVSDNWTLTWTAAELPEGIYTNINVTVTDVRGGTDTAVYTGTLIVDKSAPTAPTINLSETEWTKNNVDTTVTSGVDTLSGVFRTEIQIDNGSWTENTGMITFTTEGSITVKARTIDSLGHISNEAVATVRIDKTNPYIRRIYVEDNKVYVVGEDTYGLNPTAHKFTLTRTSTITDVQAIITSGDPFHMALLIEGGRDLQLQSTVWIANNYIDNVKQQDVYLIKVRDRAGNEVQQQVTVNKTAGTIYGELSQAELDALAEAERQKLAAEAAAAASAAQLKALEQQQEAAEQALAQVVTIADETPVNSQTGQIVVDLTGMVQSMYAESSLIKNFRYRLELSEKTTGTLIYSKILENTEKIVIPDLDDATTYIINIAIINEKGDVINEKEFEQSTPDRTPPVITAIRTTNSNFMVEAEDNKTLAYEAYKFQVLTSSMYDTADISGNTTADTIERYRRLLAAGNSSKWKLNTWTTVNSLEGVPSGTVIKTIVRDSSNNTVENISIVETSNQDLLKLINKDNPLLLSPGTTGDIKKYFNMSGNIEYSVSDSSIAQIDENGLIYGLRKGIIVITAKNLDTGEVKQLLVKIQTIITIDVRRIIVEKDSLTNIKAIYKEHLIGIFGTTEELIWESSDTGIASINGQGELKAIDYGICKVNISGDKPGRNIVIYIIVAKAGTVKSNIQQIGLNVAYILKKGTKINLENISEFIDFKDKKTFGNFVVYETTAPNIAKIEDNTVIALNEGIAEIAAIDLINGIIAKVKLRVEDVTLKKIKFSDINNSCVKKELESSTVLRLMKGKDGSKLRPDDKTTNAEFLTILSRVLLMNDNSDIFTRNEFVYKGLSESDWSYTYAAYSLSKVSPLFAASTFGNKFNQAETITRGEVAEIILSLTKGKLKKKVAKYNMKDLKGDEHEEALRYCIETGIFKGYSSGKIGGKDKLTRAQMILVLDRLLKAM